MEPNVQPTAIDDILPIVEDIESLSAAQLEEMSNNGEEGENE